MIEDLKVNYGNGHDIIMWFLYQYMVSVPTSFGDVWTKGIFCTLTAVRTSGNVP